MQGDEELIIQKTEEITLESQAPIDANKDDVEKLTDKLAKQVDEAYVVKDKKDEDKKTTGVLLVSSRLLFGDDNRRRMDDFGICVAILCKGSSFCQVRMSYDSLVSVPEPSEL